MQEKLKALRVDYVLDPNDPDYELKNKINE